MTRPEAAKLLEARWRYRIERPQGEVFGKLICSFTGIIEDNRVHPVIVNLWDAAITEILEQAKA